MKDSETGRLLWECGSLGAEIFRQEIEGKLSVVSSRLF